MSKARSDEKPPSIDDIIGAATGDGARRIIAGFRERLETAGYEIKPKPSPADTRKLELQARGRDFAILSMIRTLYADRIKREPDVAAAENLLSQQRRSLEDDIERMATNMRPADKKAFLDYGLGAVRVVFRIAVNRPKSKPSKGGQS